MTTQPNAPAATHPAAFITGATGGIGHALAHALLPDYDLILHGRNTDKLRALQADLTRELQNKERKIELLTLELTETTNFKTALQQLTLKPTHLIHNAGIARLGQVAETPAETWAQTLSVNVTAPAELTRLLLPSVQQGRGTIVFINSGAGLRANAGWGAYAASKHALKALADALRQEVAAGGVRVSSIYPSRTATDMQRAVREWEGESYDAGTFIQPETVADVVRYVLEAPRDTSLDDVSVRGGPH